MADALLQVENLYLHFRATQGVVQAVDDVSFELRRNEAMVVLGESGCGKTTLAKAILRLLPRNVHKYTGKVCLDGSNLMELSDENFRKDIRWVKISMVPQAAMNSLNPVVRVGDQVAEPMEAHFGLKKEGLAQARAVFQRVGVPVDFMSRYAFELSGGMRQRVAIAMALVTSPDIVLLDEPTSALDVLTQANIMNVLKRIKQETETSFILITHDISTSSELANRVAGMYAGQIVEQGPVRDLFSSPLHPYTRGLMNSVPRMNGPVGRDLFLKAIPGTVPPLYNLPAACRFQDRCPEVFAVCRERAPALEEIVPGHDCRCWLHGKDR